MAKLQTKPDNFNPFGGLFSIFKTFDKFAFSNGDIFASGIMASSISKTATGSRMRVKIQYQVMLTHLSPPSCTA